MRLKITNICILIFTFFLFSNCLAYETTLDTVHPETDSIQIRTKRDSVIIYAESFIGTPYCYGSQDPAKGFDCSGFVNYVFKNFDIKLPRSSRDFINIGDNVSLAECEKGDIMIFSGRDINKRPIGHVGIVYENTNGNVKFIHSATSKKRGVVISDFNTTKYYNQRLVAIKKVIIQ